MIEDHTILTKAEECQECAHALFDKTWRVVGEEWKNRGTNSKRLASATLCNLELTVTRLFISITGLNWKLLPV